MYTQNQSTGEDQNQSNDHKKDSQGKGNKEESPFMRSQRYAKWSLLGTVGICTPLFIVMNGKPKTDEEGNEILDEYSEKPVPIAYMKRAWAEVNLVKKDIVEPSSKKLLPDPLEEPYYQPPYTLVIELMDVFLRPVYDSVTGWRFKKRPGIDYFLSQVGPPMYEVVVFTRETGMTAFPLIDSMDSKGYIMYRLFRDSARYQSGFSLGEITKGEMPKLDPYYQKDLKYLNRDLSRVIMVDCDRRACEKQPENGLCLNKWDGDSNDTALFDLAALLRTIATSDVDDVRPILKHYSGYSDPLHAFKLAQARMQQETTQLKEMPKTNSELFARTGSALSSFFRRR
uniref:Mitochondrial import inner membrane translocase subunit TIM50 n=1 Tax=Ciona savignyi TaxID=51511 RepID=H2ZQK7_CIOSA